MRQFRPFFIFLAKFFGVYAFLGIMYRLYLNRYDTGRFEVDGFSWSVARQVKALLEVFGRKCELLQHELQPSIKVILDGHYVSRIVEGCNAISVMILFLAFVVAFKGKWKTTVLFCVLGIVVIHLLNVLRIALLSMALIKYPESEHFLHGVLFPAAIYGTVFLLWFIWVNKFSDHAKK